MPFKGMINWLFLTPGKETVINSWVSFQMLYNSTTRLTNVVEMRYI